MTQVQALGLVAKSMDQQRGTLFLWVPICLAIGIGIYFSLRFEPADEAWYACAAIILVLAVFARFSPSWISPILIGVAVVISGAGIAKLRVEQVRAPILEFRYYGPIEGRVVEIDRSASDAVRITMDRVVLRDIRASRTPERVRVSLHGEQPNLQHKPGDTLILTGHLSPPSGPAEPGGFDFQRHAWFDRLGAVGYTRTPVLRSSPAEAGLSLFVHRLRAMLSQNIQNSMEGKTGAFAAAIMTGDRSGMDQASLEALRASNLAHLLAISGLHMGLLTGFVFASLRYALALLPFLALRYPIKKISACVALAVGAFYLALSGGNVATLRAYIMVSVMFGAVLCDKRAVTLRSVAIAAVIVLVLTPEALVGPGFQMSFAATTALVWTFSALRQIEMYRWPGWAQMLANVFVSSGVAGLATAPIAAAHFNQIAHLGLIANVLSVPLMGMLVMPAAVLSLCLAPLGLWELGLWFMDKGLRWILFVAETVSARPEALSHVVSPYPSVLAVLSLGCLFFILWRGPARFIGLPIALSAFVIWSQVERADVLIADTGALIDVMAPEGRALSKARGNGFVAGIWLENDGAPVEQEVAASRPTFRAEDRKTQAELGPWSIVKVSGKTALSQLNGCGGADFLISNQVVEGERPCVVFDVAVMRAAGAIAIYKRDGVLHLKATRDITGFRPWNDWSWRENANWPRVVEPPAAQFTQSQ